MDQTPLPSPGPPEQPLTPAKEGAAVPRAAATSRDAIAGMMRIETELVAWERSASPEERPARTLASEAIRTARKRRQTELELTGLTVLPACIRDLEWVQTLTLAGCTINKLDVLPRALKHLHASNAGIVAIAALPHTLETLAVQNNRIEMFTDLPPHLLTLQAACNQLHALPDLPASLLHLCLSENQLARLPELPSGLLVLDVHANNLIALPGIPPSISILDATSNYLRDIPDSLTRIAQPWKILLEHNPLSEAVLERIEALLQSRTGPELFLQRGGGLDAPNQRMAVFRVSAVSGNGLMLASQVNYWCALAGLEDDDIAALRDVWDQIETDITANQGAQRLMPFIRLLEALQTLAAEEPRPLQEMMGERIAILLSDVSRDQTLLHRIIDAAQTTQDTHQGRPVAALHIFELAKEQSDALRGGHDRETLIALGNKVYAEAVMAELIEDTAIDRRPDVSINDLTAACQIRLYRLMWTPEPSPEQMQWAAERISDAQTAVLADLLEERLGDADMRMEFFIDWEPWLTYLQAAMPPALHAASLQMMEHADRLNEQWSMLDMKLELATAMVGEESASAQAIADEREALDAEYEAIARGILLPVQRKLTKAMLGILPG
ncbi:MAG: hypothetical protein H7315_14655 [Herminiimonas sp.]|nr:hypothetical protein [Herminiimonas sp.]